MQPLMQLDRLIFIPWTPVRPSLCRATDAIVTVTPQPYRYAPMLAFGKTAGDGQDKTHERTT